MNLKELIEKRNAKVVEMGKLVEKAETEKRAMTEEETKKFNDLDNEVKQLDGTIASAKRAQELTLTKEEKEEKKKEEDIEETERRAFENYIRSTSEEERAATNMTKGDNGAVIGTTIANKIIKKVVDISPIFARATRYNVKGNLSIPKYDESTQSISVAYADEFKELESSAGKFGTIDLKGFLAGSLSLISRSLINNSNFDIVTFVINDMAEKIAIWIEKELLIGTTSKIEGLSGTTEGITAAATTAITADEVIKLKDTIKDIFQKDAIFIMHSDTRTALRLLKDTTGKYLLNDDVTSPFGTTLLGKPVYVSDNMPKMEAGKVAIYYGDVSGLAVKISEDINVQVLNEKYATQHAVGVVAWLEIDSKIENVQKIAKLTMKAA